MPPAEHPETALHFGPFAEASGNTAQAPRWLCTDSATGKTHEVTDIRLLPMSEKHLKPDEAACIELFLTRTLPERAGNYLFPTHSVATPKGALFLFQYKRQLVGHALCIGEELYGGKNKEGYIGHYRLLPESIAFYDEPLSSATFYAMGKNLPKLGRTVSRVPLSFLPTLFRHLKNQRRQSILIIAEECRGGDEGNTPASERLREGARREKHTSSSQRNPKAPELCKRAFRLKHGGKLFCAICGVDLADVYGPEFGDCLECHHLIPLSTYGMEHPVKPEKDMIPACPTCHTIAHRREPPYTPDEIRAMLARQKPI